MVRHPMPLVSFLAVLQIESILPSYSGLIVHSSSRVPKELISRFVKICPTCQVRRGGSHLSPPDSRRNSPPMALSRIQPPQSQITYMRAQNMPSMAEYDEYRRSSTSSSSYDYSERPTREWDAYSSPISRHSEMAWSPPPPHPAQAKQPHGVLLSSK